MEVKDFDKMMAQRTYVQGFLPTQADTQAFRALGSEPGAEFPHAGRFYRHMRRFTQHELNSFPAPSDGAASVAKPAPTAIDSTKPPAEPKKDKGKGKKQQQKQQKPQQEKKAPSAPVDITKLANSVLAVIDGTSSEVDSLDLAKQLTVDHATVVEALKPLIANEFLTQQVVESQQWRVTEEGEGVVKDGSPEARVFNAISNEGTTVASLDSLVGSIGKIGMSHGLKAKWLRVDKSSGQPTLYKQVDKVEDEQAEAVRSLTKGKELDKKTLDALKKRKWVERIVQKSFRVGKGPNFGTTFAKLQADLTQEMIASGQWETSSFKPLRLDVAGRVPDSGYLHPLLKMREEFRQIFLELGFSEMPTNRFVESSFWNFDALFQPQAHPARDAHDTFFTSNPTTTLTIPEDYMARVKEMHSSGDHESRGWRYDWKESEARRNILRTHTTAISSRMLYKLAQDGFKPCKLFSIDRVFRNEKLDATHLAEFHQIEGVVCGQNLGLADLMGVIKLFFERIGLDQIRFKPAYNPYTEPSMEIFYDHPDPKVGLMEIGNSGVFRPEMLRPMGLPKDCTVIAWGFGLEREAMIKKGLSNIRELFGHGVKFENILDDPICRLDVHN